MGFANSVFYANSSAFNDITSGNNACPASVGYSATAGWDACTGLGSPIGTALAALFTPSAPSSSASWSGGNVLQSTPSVTMADPMEMYGAGTQIAVPTPGYNSSPLVCFKQKSLSSAITGTIMIIGGTDPLLADQTQSAFIDNLVGYLTIN